MISSKGKRESKVFPKIIFLLIIALVIRLLVSYGQYSGDVKNHLTWGTSLIDSGPAGLYLRHFPGFNDANYPPVAIILFGAAAWLYQLIIGLVTWLNTNLRLFPSFLLPLSASFNMQVAFLKLPSILADLGIGYLIYLTRPPKSHPLLYASLYLFNPAIIYLSSVWGQIEPLPVAFLLLSYYFIKIKKSFYLSHLAFVIAILCKQTALWLTPLFLIVWWKEGGFKKIISGLCLQIVFFFLIYLPFVAPIGAIGSYLSTLAGSSNHVTDQAFNLWYFIYGWAARPDNITLLNVSVRTWSIILVAASFIGLGFIYFRKYKLSRLGSYLFLFSLFAFFFQTRVHDRHLAPALPFLLISTLSAKFLIPLYLLLSAFHFLNLYLALRLPFL